MNIRKIGLLRKLVYMWRNIRNKHSYISGSNNKIKNRGGQKVNSRIQVSGNGNTVVIEKDAMLRRSRIRIIGNNNFVRLKSNSYISGAELWVENDGCQIVVGERTFIGHHSHLACTENDSKMIIGDDCMISSYVQVRTGEGAKILKGVVLEGDDVVATGAIVTKSFQKNLLIAGVPGKIIKDNITWDKERI